MIWHIFKKDWKLLWPLVLIVAATHIISAALWLKLGFFGEPASLRMLAQSVIVVQVVGIMALVAAVVHQDALPGDRQDWLVRPIRRRDLVLAKLLFVLAAVHGPMVLVDLVHCMVVGFGFQESLSASLSRGVYMLGLISLPVMGIAAMTSTIIEAIGGLLAIFIVLVIFIVGVVVVAGNGANNFPAMSGHQYMFQLWSVVALVAAAIVIPLQYFRRATMRARAIALGALLALIPVTASISWSSAFAFEQLFSVDPAAAKAVTVAFDPMLGKLALKPGAVNRANSVWLPLHLSGLARDSVVFKDRAIVRIIGQDGAVLYSGLTVGDPQTAGNSGGDSPAIDDFPARTEAGTDIRTHQFIVLPRRLYESVRSQPVRLELDYALTLFHVESSDAIPALGGDKRVANLGRCMTKLDDDGDEVELGCLITGSARACTSFALENPANRKRNRPFNPCGNYFVPYDGHFDPNAMLHGRANLGFRDPQGLAKYPVDTSQLDKAQVSIKTYQPVAHFTRHLIIPEIRLGDWEAETPVAVTGTVPDASHPRGQ